jgi:CBS domain containing-hemolysin-like protein
MAATLVSSFALLSVGAVLAGLESSLVTLPEARLRALRDELGDEGVLLERYLANPNRTLSRLLAGRVLAPIAATVLLVPWFVVRGDPWWVLALVMLAIAFVYGLLVEVGVSVGRRRARAIAPRALSWMRPIALLLAPFAAPLAAVGALVSSRLRDRKTLEPPPLTEKEVEYVVEEAQSAGAVDPLSSRMLQNVFEIKNRTARDIMVPRTRIVALEVNTPLDAAVRRLSEEAHSRVPVYRGQIDNVVGVLIAKDLFRVATERLSMTAPADTQPPPTIDALMRRPVLFVTDTQPVLTALRDMQSKRTHLAVVVDEFGAMVGLITLEDVLEELVGEIEDEHDERNVEAEFAEIAAGRFMAAAAIPIETLGERLDVEFPPDGDYASLGGFLAARAGKVPEVGAVVLWEGLRFIIREGDKRRVTKVEIVRDPSRLDAN